MQRRCQKCGGFRFRTVDEEYVVCRKCGTVILRDHVRQAQVSEFQAEESIEQGMALLMLVS